MRYWSTLGVAAPRGDASEIQRLRFVRSPAFRLFSRRPDLVLGQLVAGRLERAGALPAPDQQHVLAGGVVEAVPVAGRREHHVAGLRRLDALVGVDLAAAAHDD